MTRVLRPAALGALLLPAAFGWGCGPGRPSPAVPGPADSSFGALQERGREAMGVDQYTSTHLFDALPDGGRIELQRDADDPAGVETIRTHLREIAAAFGAGDFSTPALVHLREMPGTVDMARLRDRIAYAYRPLPRGGEVRITTADPEALRAVHAFMEAQRTDHRAGGAGDHGEHGDHRGHGDHGRHGH